MVLKHKGSPSGPYALEKTTVEMTFANVEPATVKRVTAAIADLRLTDMAVASFPDDYATADLGVVGAKCSAAGVLQVSLINPTAATITAGTIVMDVTILRFS